MWAAELEQWLPSLLRPSDIQIVPDSNHMLHHDRTEQMAKVVVVSYTMCRMLNQCANLHGRGWKLAV
jgi:stress-induced morphogen